MAQRKTRHCWLQTGNWKTGRLLWRHNRILAKKFGLSYNHNLPVKNKRYNFNERYFQEIDSEEKAYWLGFIMADGCLSSSKKQGKPTRLDIILKSDDAAHLEKLVRSLEADIPVKISDVIDKRGFITTKCEVRVNSTIMCEDLMNWEVFPRKTGLENIPNKLAQQLIPSFIRGFFDGDGSICKVSSGYYYRMHMGSCSEKILKQIRSFLADNDIHIGLYKTDRYSKPFYYLDSTCKKECNKFFHLLYDNASIYLDRKMERALKMFQICSPEQ